MARGRGDVRRALAFGVLRLPACPGIHQQIQTARRVGERRQHRGRLPFGAGRVHVGSCFDQPAQAPPLASRAGPHRRRPAQAVARVEIGSVLDQQIERFFQPLLGAAHQRRLPLPVGGVGVGAFAQQHRKRSLPAHRLHHHGDAKLVFRVGIGPMHQKPRDRLGMIAAKRPFHGGAPHSIAPIQRRPGSPERPHAGPASQARRQRHRIPLRLADQGIGALRNRLPDPLDVKRPKRVVKARLRRVFFAFVVHDLVPLHVGSALTCAGARARALPAPPRQAFVARATRQTPAGNLAPPDPSRCVPNRPTRGRRRRVPAAAPRSRDDSFWPPPSAP